MYVGPTASKFITPGVLGVLQDTFGLKLISGDVKADMEIMLG